MTLSPTPFDDVYKTLCVTCPTLILPLLNEAFGTADTGNEQIEQEETEHHFTEADGTQRKRISDNVFTVTKGNDVKRYIFECESNPDGSILVRFFEYALLSGLANQTLENNTLTIPLPHVAVLFLRSAKTSSSTMTVRIRLPDGSESRMIIPIIRLHNYTIPDLFRKKLYILFPFSLFLYEKKFAIIEKDDQLLHQFTNEITGAMHQLLNINNEELNDYQKSVLRTMFMIVLQQFGQKHETILKGVQKSMGGHVIDLPETCPASL